MSCSIPEAEPPFETTPEIVAPLELEFAPDAVGEGCAPSGAAGDGDFEELHAMALTSPTTTTVSRTERGAAMSLILVEGSPAREPNGREDEVVYANPVPRRRSKLPPQNAVLLSRAPY
jgi:hypothetical protein